MAEVILTSHGKEILINELQKYYKNFGSMNKNDFEVLLFHALMNNGDKERSNYELSRLLRIPETKVKRLRYEVDLKYGSTSEIRYRNEKLQQLDRLLENVAFKSKDQLIEFVVEDIALRQFLDNLLKSNNRFSDSSFNSEIVKIDLTDLNILLCAAIEDKEVYDRILKQAEKTLKEPTDLKKYIPELIQLVATGAPLLANFSLSGLFALLPSLGSAAVKALKKSI